MFDVASTHVTTLNDDDPSALTESDDATPCCAASSASASASMPATSCAGVVNTRSWPLTLHGMRADDGHPATASATATAPARAMRIVEAYRGRSSSGTPRT